MDEASLAPRLEDVVWHSESPVPDVNGMGRLAMAEAARSSGLKVVLTGQSMFSMPFGRMLIVSRRGGI